MSKRISNTGKKYLESNVSERYQDAAERIFKAHQKQLAQRNPGDLHLGPYLIVANGKLKSHTSAKEKEVQSSEICTIL